MAAKVHPELRRELAKADTRPVQAVLQLRAPDQPERLPSPEEAARLAGLILRRVEAELGYPAVRANVLRNLATLVVEADRRFLASLLEQAEVTAAVPNQSQENPSIPPVRKRAT